MMTSGTRVAHATAKQKFTEKEPGGLLASLTEGSRKGRIKNAIWDRG